MRELSKDVKVEIYLLMGDLIHARQRYYGGEITKSEFEDFSKMIMIRIREFKKVEVSKR